MKIHYLFYKMFFLLWMISLISVLFFGVMMDYAKEIPVGIFTYDLSLGCMVGSLLFGGLFWFAYYFIFGGYSRFYPLNNFQEFDILETKEETSLERFDILCEMPISVEILPVKGHIKRGKYNEKNFNLSYVSSYTCIRYYRL